MSDEREPLDGEARELRALYRSLQPPTTADELAEADPGTVRAVEWMRAAYRGLVVPPCALPRATPRPRRAARPVPRVLALAAAAAALVLGAAALWRRLARPAANPGPERVAQVPAPVAREGVEILSVLPDRLELRCGPVRLVLLDPPPPASADGPPGS
ncbi:MAG: hypothetical protein EXS08_16260 [Planctomycetes bacterium]|nr:hypothetical protein [Planctomycetota bacterium]